jgi:hypothetical protein
MIMSTDIVDELQVAVEFASAPKVVQHTPDERLAKVRLGAEIDRGTFRLQIQDHHAALQTLPASAAILTVN